MSFYLLPSINANTKIQNSSICDMIHGKLSDKVSFSPIINKTLHDYLNKIKLHIETNTNEWDKYKKFTNPYEFIHTIIPNTKQSVSSLKPLSRSFYKMIEICKLLSLLENIPAKCKSFHLAEGPGGFIEAIAQLRSNKDDLYYGMTLIDNLNNNVPGWKKTDLFLKTYKNVIIESGKDGTGDLMVAENLRYCYEKYHGQMDLITADGGFDFSVDFNNQETSSLKLIFCQIAFAISMQKLNGTFIIKFFDTFTKLSLDLLYLLSNVYEQVYFVKPCTSRYANSEKYIVCKKFKLDNTEMIIKKMYNIILNFKNNNLDDDNNNNIHHQLESLFEIEIPYFYSNKVEECNAIFGQQQIENIYMTINLIINANTTPKKNEKLETLKKNNIIKCNTWCQQHNIPFNKQTQNSNIFLMNKT
jgi:23S rRNA U2552 (ribose-2'-O)-methylase RlmE/FtsJ